MEKILLVFGLSMGVFNNNHATFTWAQENVPESSIMYLNQGYSTIKGNKKVYYADYYILDQINESITSPEDIQNYVCKERKVKMLEC